jgi:hypothetical protein
VKNVPKLLIAGDLMAIAVVTVIGFATHGEAGTAVLPRMLTTFLPLCLGWFLVAPLLGLYSVAVTSDMRQQWRPFLVMLIAGPMAALMRAILLNTVVIPIFGVVLSASTGLGMLAWRALWALRRSSK